MKKVKMILTNRFTPDVRVYKEAKYLVDKGFDVEILCWDRENEYVDREIEIVEGIKIKRFFPYSEYGTGLKQFIPFIKFIKECKEYLKGKNYQYLHCHDLDGVIAGYFARKNGAKIIFDMHEFYEVNGKKQRIRCIVRWIVRFFQGKSHCIIYVNSEQANPVLNRDKEKLIYLPNYPEIKNYSDCDKIESDKLRISYIGAVRQYNELKNLMDACNDMNNVFISVHGSGIHTDKLKLIEKNYNNVQVTGKYHFLESARLYAECDILYIIYPMASIQNKIAIPVKFYEAIITKTPMIINKGKDLEGFVKSKDIGFVVDGSNVEEIRELIMYINGNRDILDEKIRNLEKIQYDYSWEEVVKNLDEIYGINDFI